MLTRLRRRASFLRRWAFSSASVAEMPLQRSPAGARPIGGNSRHSAKVGEDPAPPKSGNGTNAKASDVRFVAALKALKYAALTFAESTPLPPMAVNHVVPVMAKTAQWLP